MSLDFRLALNTISDVVQNRPPPLREFDQIYMKVGDMVIQAEFIARIYDGKNVIFIGDGDAISLSIIHMKNKDVFSYGPNSIQVLDFDERIVNSINRFAEDNDIEKQISATLYNVADPLPVDLIGIKDAFYTNPPWGASNDGESVATFMQRGFEAVGKDAMGAIVIADDKERPWSQVVLRNTQQVAIDAGYVVSEMIPGLHLYHLDDAPDLASCTLVISKIEGNDKYQQSHELEMHRLVNFYGHNSPLKVLYVRDKTDLHPGKAVKNSYEIVPLEGKK